MTCLEGTLPFPLVDGTFSQAALKGKIQLKEQLPKYFGGEIKLGKCFEYVAFSIIIMVCGLAST